MLLRSLHLVEQIPPQLTLDSPQQVWIDLIKHSSLLQRSHHLCQVKTSSLALGQQSSQVLGPDGDGEGGQQQRDHLVGHPSTLGLHLLPLPSLPLITGLSPLAGGADEQLSVGIFAATMRGFKETDRRLHSFEGQGHQYPTFMKQRWKVDSGCQWWKVEGG